MPFQYPRSSGALHRAFVVESYFKNGGIKAKHKGRNRGDPGADDSSGDGKSWSKTETVFEKWREISE